MTDTPPTVPLSIASPDCAEEFFAGQAPRCVTLRHAASLAGLREVLDHFLDGPAHPATLDLIGHSTRGHRLLRLGATAIDMLDRHVAGFFHTLAHDQLLTRLHVTAVRLLGCEPAVTDAGQLSPCSTRRWATRGPAPDPRHQHSDRLRARDHRPLVAR